MPNYTFILLPPPALWLIFPICTFPRILPSVLNFELHMHLILFPEESYSISDSWVLSATATVVPWHIFFIWILWMWTFTNFSTHTASTLFWWETSDSFDKGSRNPPPGYFTVRLTPRGRRGGGVCPSALTVSKCENFDPILLIEIWVFDTQNTFYLIVRGLKMHLPLTPLLYRYLIVLWQSCSGGKEKWGILVVGWKWLFWLHLIKIWFWWFCFFYRTPFSCLEAERSVKINFS